MTGEQQDYVDMLTGRVLRLEREAKVLYSESLAARRRAGEQCPEALASMPQYVRPYMLALEAHLQEVEEVLNLAEARDAAQRSLTRYLREVEGGGGGVGPEADGPPANGPGRAQEPIHAEVPVRVDLQGPRNPL